MDGAGRGVKGEEIQRRGEDEEEEGEKAAQYMQCQRI